MRFFNVDLHISVIEDVAWILRRLGHTVEDTPSATPVRRGKTMCQVWSTSTLVGSPRDCGVPPADVGLPSDFDAFIVTFSPCFAVVCGSKQSLHGREGST